MYLFWPNKHWNLFWLAYISLGPLSLLSWRIWYLNQVAKRDQRWREEQRAGRCQYGEAGTRRWLTESGDGGEERRTWLRSAKRREKRACLRSDARLFRILPLPFLLIRRSVGIILPLYSLSRKIWRLISSVVKFLLVKWILITWDS